LQVEERYELVHNLEHFILDRSCKHCVVAAQRGLGSEAAKRQGASTSQDKWRASEIDVCMEAIDFAIDYKQVRFFKRMANLNYLKCLTLKYLNSERISMQ
jgi:hypothetical protein